MGNSETQDKKTTNRNMAVWADNIKFVREIIESKFNKIDNSIAEINEGAEMLENDPSSNHGKEHFTFALRNLELVQPAEIEMLLETIVGDLHENERKAIETMVNEKLAKRTETLEKSKELKKKLNL